MVRCGRTPLGELLATRLIYIALQVRTVLFESVRYPQHYLMVRQDGSVDCVKNQTNDKGVISYTMIFVLIYHDFRALDILNMTLS